jgi:hypothetical protein
MATTSLEIWRGNKLHHPYKLCVVRSSLNDTIVVSVCNLCSEHINPYLEYDLRVFIYIKLGYNVQMRVSRHGFELFFADGTLNTYPIFCGTRSHCPPLQFSQENT